MTARTVEPAQETCMPKSSVTIDVCGDRTIFGGADTLTLKVNRILNRHLDAINCIEVAHTRVCLDIQLSRQGLYPSLHTVECVENEPSPLPFGGYVRVVSSNPTHRFVTLMFFA